MTVTDLQEMKTAGIHRLAVGKDGGQEVLLIALKEAYLNKPQYQKSLKREYDQCRDLDHAHLMKYLAFKDIEEFGPCIELEWSPSRSLLTYMGEGHSEDEKKRVVEQVADALDYLHQNGRVHGALDPAYIFVDNKTDEVKVLNFRMRYADSMNVPASSLRYLAPEAKDGTVMLDARADIYSLGVLMKDMQLGADYQHVVAGCCSFGRSERFASVAAFEDAFEHRRLSRGSESSAPAGSKKLLLLAGAIAVLVVVAAVLLFHHGDNRQASAPATADSTMEQTANAESNDSVSGSAVNHDDSTADQNAQAALNADAQQYTGDLAFLRNLVPQMHIDLDKIYASSTDPDVVHKKVAIYYKGLRKTLGNLNEQQFAAFDKAFSDYIKSKQ